MTTLTLTAKAIQEQVKTARLSHIPWKAVVIALATLCFVALLSYVFLVNQLTQGTYLIKSGNKQLNALMQENVKLQARFAESGLLGSVQEKAYAMNFGKTTKITYIELVGNTIASK